MLQRDIAWDMNNVGTATTCIICITILLHLSFQLISVMQTLNTSTHLTTEMIFYDKDRL